MKNSFYLLLVFFMGLFVSCGDNDDETFTFPVDESTRIYYENYSFTLLHNNKGTWEKAQELEEIPVGLEYHTGNKAFWFYDNALYGKVTYRILLDFTESFNYIDDFDYNSVYVKTAYGYNKDTKELTTTEQVLQYENSGYKYYVEKINKEELVIRIEYPEDYAKYTNEDACRTTYKAVRSPKKSECTFFDSREEARHFYMTGSMD